MDKVAVASLATIAAGALVALQPPVNATLGEAIGSVPAAAVNFGVGFVVLFALALALGGGLSQFGDAREVAWYYIVGGGILGAVYVGTVVVTVASLGAAGVTAATVAGQLTASVVADRAGILGLTERAITPARVVGVILLAVGVFLVIRE